MNEFEIYSGKLVYKEIEFDFIFDKKQLKLIPPKEKSEEVKSWRRCELLPGVYTQGYPQYIENSYLLGMCNETGRKILFFPVQDALCFCNSLVLVSIDAYIIFESYDEEIKKVNRISFSSPEINCIFPILDAIDTYQYSKEGIYAVTTKAFADTVSEKQEFLVDGKKVSIHFATGRSISRKINKPPMTLESFMIFEFEPTIEYEFLLRLWRVAKRFIQYLCYRENCYLSTITIREVCTEKQYQKESSMYIVNEQNREIDESLYRNRYIKQEYISGVEGKILSDIASNQLYMRHIPETFLSGRNIDAARFVMITAAFEWEFHRNYPNGVKKSEKTLNTEKTVSIEIEKLINTAENGRIKKKYQFLHRLIKADSLEKEIIQIGKDYSELMNIFGNQLYALNKSKLKYTEMGKRLGSQRNNFAHGNLDKEFDDLALLDLVYLEYLIYAIQLKSYGVDNEKIQAAINELFRCGLGL